LEPEERWGKVERFLKSAELVLEDGDFDTCASRCYYAIFHAMIWCFEEKEIKEIEKWKVHHVLLQAKFKEYFTYREKIFKQEVYAVIVDMYAYRVKGDYEIEAISRKRAGRILRRTKELLRILKGALKK